MLSLFIFNFFLLKKKKKKKIRKKKIELIAEEKRISVMMTTYDNLKGNSLQKQ